MLLRCLVFLLSSTNIWFLYYSMGIIIHASEITDPLQNIATDSSTATIHCCTDVEPLYGVTWRFASNTIGDCKYPDCDFNDATNNFTLKANNSLCYLLIINNLRSINLTENFICRVEFDDSQPISLGYITHIDSPVYSSVYEVDEGSNTTLTCSVQYNGIFPPFLVWILANNTEVLTENYNNNNIVVMTWNRVLSRYDSRQQIICSIKHLHNASLSIPCGGINYCAQNIPYYTKDEDGQLPLVRYPPDTVEIILEDNKLICRHDGNLADNNTHCIFMMNTVIVNETSCELLTYDSGLYQCIVIYYFHGRWTNITSDITNITKSSETTDSQEDNQNLLPVIGSVIGVVAAIVAAGITVIIVLYVRRQMTRKGSEKSSNYLQENDSPQIEPDYSTTQTALNFENQGPAVYSQPNNKNRRTDAPPYAVVNKNAVNGASSSSSVNRNNFEAQAIQEVGPDGTVYSGILTNVRPPTAKKNVSLPEEKVYESSNYASIDGLK